MEDQKGFIQIPLLIAIVAGVLVLGGGGYFGIHKYKNYQAQKVEQKKQIELNQKTEEENRQKLQESLDSQSKELEKQKSEIEVLKNQKPQTIVKEISAPVPMSIADVVKKWSPRIAQIACTNDGTNYILGSGTLTEFVKGNPIILTNAHVVASDGTAYAACFFQLNKDSESYELDTKSFDFSPQDVAYILTSLSSSLNSNVTMPSKGEMKICTAPANIGDKILILGYPMAGGTGGSITATDGIISSYDGQYYVTSAKIDHGNSGGAAILIKDDCYLGIPTWAENGGFESYGRILSQSYFLGHDTPDILR